MSLPKVSISGLLSVLACMIQPAAHGQAPPASALHAVRRSGSNTFPIDLPTALRLAHAQNLDVQIAQERLREARANQESARLQFLPWISSGATFRRHEGRIQAVDGTMLDADKQSYAVGGSLTAQMDLGDAIYKSLAGHQLVAAAGHALETQQQDSTLAAAQGYYDLAKAKALQDVLREALSISQDYQNQLHEAVGAGVAFKGDELRVQVQTERYQLARRQADEQQRLSAARLALILHLDPSVELIPQSNDLVPLTLFPTNPPLAVAIEQAIRTRPEVRQSQSLTAAARNAKDGAVFGPLIPSLGAQASGGGLGGGKNESTGNFGSSEDYFIGLGWRIGPGGLFDFGRVHASKARLELARLNGEKTRDEVIRQVVESHTRMQSLADQIQAAQQNLTTATEALRLTRERKQYGVGIVLEDIQAQQELTRARSDYLSAIADFNKAQYGLNKAMGNAAAIGQAAGPQRNAGAP